jgi:tetratricopeptide (TPR) repeat protein/tRNA A-37 threonylcarbamoyl transferase component Bud32
MPDPTPPADSPDDGGTLIGQPAHTAEPAPFVPPQPPADGSDVPATAAPLAGTLVGHSAAPQVAGASAAHQPAPSAVRFRTLRLHARGGLGQVFVALDEELGREVALKEIQLQHADHHESRERFLLEAEITGSLEHPGVVPVYGMGVYADGRPFYAMRFIKGGSFQDAIRRFHDADVPGRDPGERALQLRDLLKHFVDACNAIAYAHSKGIIHRDIKPANVMLGHYGETLVVDWGLAKQVGKPDTATAGAGTPHPPRPVSGRSTATQAGSALGTPAFMSPEQAAGKLDEMGPASDVYSLGATLYCLLSGSQPFRQTDLVALLGQVQQGQFPPPHEVKAVPAALEAVCLKAMALRPDDRYLSARALAEDVERWLADEPTSAYREPWNVRAARWARRHRTVVAASAGLLLTAVVALAVSTVLVSRERQKAEASFHTAQAAVDDLLTEVAQEQLVSEPRAEKKRKALLAKARTYYERFLEQRGDDPKLRKDVALAHKRLGDISRLLAEYRQAREEYDRAISLLSMLAADHPGDAEYRATLAETQCNLGEVWRLTSHPADARDAYDSALRLQTRLVEEHPDNPAYRKELARTQNNRGILFWATNRPDQAEQAYGSAIERLARLTTDDPAEPSYRQLLARAHLNLGPVLRARNQPDKAEKTYREAIRLQEELVKADRDNPDYRYELGVTCVNLGFLFASRKQQARAAEQYEKATALFNRLALDFPNVPAYRKELAATQNNLAIVHARKRDWAAAGQAWEEALAQFEKLASDHPEETDYEGHRGIALGNLGWLALQQQTDLLAASAAAVAPPGPFPFNASLAACESRRNELLALACRRLDEARRLERLALKPNPGNPRYQQALRDQTEYLAEARLLLGKHAEAAEVAAELPAVFRTRGDDYFLAAELLARCATLAKSDPRLSEAERRSAGVRYADRAMAALKRGVEVGCKDARQRLEKESFEPLRGREDFGKLLSSLIGTK